MLTAFNEINYSYLKRRQVMIIDSAFPIKSGPRFGRQIRQIENVDSKKGFRFQNFNFLFFQDNLSTLDNPVLHILLLIIPQYI